MNRILKRVDEVVGWRLCSGCGACVPMCPNKAISLIDVFDQGIRPKVDLTKCQKCGECLKVCPGIELSHSRFDEATIFQLRQSWGPVLEVWEGYATDPGIRFKGSSGGAATALALYCLEKEKMKGVLHISGDSKQPLSNIAVFSRNREDLLRRTGSRYSPAAPCEKLDMIKEAGGMCVFLGKPCDIAALRKFQKLHPEFNTKIGLTISIFCAGTPSTAGTYKLLDSLDIKADDVSEIRYRGFGWPGMTSVTPRGDTHQKRQMTYENSWGSILCNHVQFRCRLCPDSTGEFADISCGDPWNRKIELNDPGWSLVLGRTEMGREILHKAMKEDYLRLERVEANTLPCSQNALLVRRRHLWGRLLVMRTMQIPVPCFEGFSLFSNWRDLPVIEKICSFAGTLKRIFQRNWTKPLKVSQEK